MTSSDLLNNPTAQQLVRGCAERYGKTLVVVNTYDSECSLTYAQLAEIVFTAAASLEERVRGRVVIVRGAVDEHLVVDLLSLLCAGQSFTPSPILVMPLTYSDWHARLELSRYEYLSRTGRWNIQGSKK